MDKQFRTFYLSDNEREYYVGTAPKDTSRLYTARVSTRSKPHLSMARHRQAPPNMQMGGYATQQFCQDGTPSDYPPPYTWAPSEPSPGFDRYDPIVATANYHSLSSKIDVTLPLTNHSFSMKQPSLVTSDRKFFAPPLGDLEWKYKHGGWFGTSRALVDKQKRPIAWYEREKRGWALGERGEARLFVLDDGRIMNEGLDVIVFTLIATLRDDAIEEKDEESILDAFLG